MCACAGVRVVRFTPLDVMSIILFFCLFVSFQITKLKIDSNPFAKGFRDSSRLTEFER